VREPGTHQFHRGEAVNLRPEALPLFRTRQLTRSAAGGRKEHTPT
jgi:hypothetical protein